MAIILHIDTAVETASVCLARGSESLQFAMNNSSKDQGGWIHQAIQKLLADAGLTIQHLDAVAVTIGPGSYTGLRVGLSAAKGICFALNKPLITINTLEMMAYATREQNVDLLCPMIDARRMEVFTAVYDKSFREIISPCAMIIDGSSFDKLLASRKVLFSGNGSKKLQEVLFHSNALFSGIVATAADMIQLAEKKFSKKEFADLAYTEPLYLKEFYSPAR